MKDNQPKALWAVLLSCLIPMWAAGQTTNAVPWSDAFEDYANGTSIHGTNGWTAGDPELAIVTNESYTYSPYPLSTSHAQVLNFQTAVTNDIVGGDGCSLVWVDMMVKPTFWTETNYPTVSNTIQGAVFFSTNTTGTGHLFVVHQDLWNNGVITNTEIDYTNVESNVWIRITLVPDYVDKVTLPSCRFFQVMLNGTVVTSPAASAAPTVRQSTGTWFRMVKTGAPTNLSAFEASGTGCIDDFQVVTNDPYGGTYYFIQSWTETSGITNKSPGGHISPLDRYQTAAGGSVTYTNWADSGYVLTGVVVDATTYLGAVSSYQFTNVNENHTIAAYFDPGGMVTLLVASAYGTPDPPVGGNTYPALTVVPCVISNTPTDGGDGTQYVCIGWTGSGSVPATGVGTSTVVTVSNNSSIAWTWRTQYLFTATNSGASGSVNRTSEWCNAGTNISVTATPDPGNHFDYWSGDVPPAGTNQNPLTLTMSQPRAIVANFAAGLTLTVSSPYGSPTPSNTTVWPLSSVATNDMSGSPITDGTTQQVCVGWTGTGSVTPGSGTNVAVTMLLNSTLAWQWDLHYYLDTASDTNGTVDVGDMWCKENTNVVIVATPNVGYHLEAWTGDVPGPDVNNNPLTLLMDQARSITGTFVLNTYTILATAGVNGDIAPTGAIAVAHGSDQTFTNGPYQRYHVGAVMVDATNMGSLTGYTFVNVVTDHTYSVTFAPNMTTNHPTPEPWLYDYYGVTNYEDVAEGDTDGDGFFGWQEYIAGTDPTDRDSYFRIIQHVRLSGSNRVVWIGGKESTNLPPFIVRRSTNLTQTGGGWTPYTNIGRTLDPTNIWYDDALPVGVPVFYRIMATTNAP